MQLSLSVLVEKLEQRWRPHSPLIIGIDGGGGAGKSVLAEKMAELRQGSTVVHMDDFYRPSAFRQNVNPRDIGALWDWTRVRDQVLLPLRQGQPAQYQIYDWDVDRLTDWHRVQSGGWVIVEGCYSLRQELEAYYDLKIWVDTPRALRLERGIERDGEAKRHLWELEWMPAEDRYLQAQNPMACADLIVDGTGAGADLSQYIVDVSRSKAAWLL